MGGESGYRLRPGGGCRLETRAVRVDFVGTLEDVNGGDVNIRRDDAKDDRALLLQVAVEEAVDVLHHVARLAGDLGAHDSR